MRRILCLTTAALVASIAVLIVASPATACNQKWYTVSVSLVAGPGHMLEMGVTVTNVGTIDHMANVVVTLKGPTSWGSSTPIAVRLAPGQSWTWGIAPTVVLKGKYTAGVSAAHVYETNDPFALKNAPDIGASSTVLVK